MRSESGILIDGNDRWFFQGAEIINDRVLTYFRANLHRDDHGLYIHNEFQGKEETAYLTDVKGFPLHALHAMPRANAAELSLDSGALLSVPYDHILMLDANTLAFLTPEGIPGRFSATAMTLIGAVLTEIDDALLWETAGGRIPVSTMSRAEFFAAFLSDASHPDART